MCISIKCAASADNAPIYQISAKFAYPRLLFRGATNYRQCFSGVSGPNCIKFGQDITTQSANARMSYWWFDQFSRPDFQGENFVPHIPQSWDIDLRKIWSGIWQSSRLPMYMCFLFQTSCFVSKSERLKMDWGRKSRPNFALFTPVKNGGGLGKIYESTFQAQSRTQSMTYFWSWRECTRAVRRWEGARNTHSFSKTGELSYTKFWENEKPSSARSKCILDFRYVGFV